jgi:hypothetical protein
MICNEENYSALSPYPIHATRKNVSFNAMYTFSTFVNMKNINLLKSIELRL